MGKMKSHSGLSKRIKRTGTGKLMAAHASAFHKAEHKSSKVKRSLRGTRVLSASDVKRIKQMVAYR